MSSSEDDIPLAARGKTNPPLLNDKGTLSGSLWCGFTHSRVDADIPVKNRIATNKVIPKRVDDLVDREVDAAGTPKPHPKSLVNKAVNSDGKVAKKKRIMVSDDDSDDDVPLVCTLQMVGINGRRNVRE
jgi:hypothetical protein